MKIKNISIKKIRIDVIVISKNIKIKMCFIKSKNNSFATTTTSTT